MQGRVRHVWTCMNGSGQESVAFNAYRAGMFFQSRMEDTHTGSPAASLDTWPHAHTDWSHTATLLQTKRTCSLCHHLVSLHLNLQISLSSHLSVHLLYPPSSCLSVLLYIIYLYVSLSISRHPSICLFIHSSNHLSINPSIHPSVLPTFLLLICLG